MTYKLIACDMDETLIGTNHKIAQENIDAIKECVKHGVKFVPATGRGFNSIEGTLQKLGLQGKKGEYVISFNGGAITENSDHHLLSFHGMPFELVNEFYKRGVQYGVCMHAYTVDKVYIYNADDDERQFLNGRMDYIEISDKDLSRFENQDWVKILYENLDRKYLEKLADDLSDITKNVDVSYSSNRYLEFNDKGVNKGAGLKVLCDKLGIDMKDVIAIGDNPNDLSMIKAAGLGAGVANSSNDIKPYCNVITEKDCNHGAVAEVIEKYVLS